MPEPLLLPTKDWLAAFDLPASWAGLPQYTLIQAGQADWALFLALWQAWRSDPQRPRLLHHVVVTPCSPSPIRPPLPSAMGLTLSPDLQALADQLSPSLWGLLPGFHRIALDDGQVLLTVCVGDVQAQLRQQAFCADAAWLDELAEHDSDHSDVANSASAHAHLHTLKSLVTCCRRGTRMATWQPSARALKLWLQCGFASQSPARHPPTSVWRGEFNPSWPLRHLPSAATLGPGTCTVVGAGLAGAAVAASLARRGWRVTMLDAAAAPASGASGLPAGILAPHMSPDDSVLSRLSRAGVRITLQQAARYLELHRDWSPTGVLERCLDHPRRQPADWRPGGAAEAAALDWVGTASKAHLASCGLLVDPSDAGPTANANADADPEADPQAVWHQRAGWIKPAQLVRAWLRTAGVQWQGHSPVSRLQRSGDGWQIFGQAGEWLATSDRVVLAAGHATAELTALLAPQIPLALQAVRGQVTWARHAPGTASACPPFPVNGHGHLLAHLPLDATHGEPAWLIGSSFQRGSTSVACSAADDAHNLARLQTLLPQCAQALTQSPPATTAWAGIRCTTPTRLPWVGPLAAADDVWVCTGMGSRGLTFAALCGELLAAQWHGEPLPIEKQLAKALNPGF